MLPHRLIPRPASVTPSHSSTPRTNFRTAALVAPAGQEREQVAHADRDQDHADREEEGVQPADVQRPDDDPDAETGGGGEDETHCGVESYLLRATRAPPRGHARDRRPPPDRRPRRRRRA